MILLDTNVVSEVMRVAPNARVRQWLDEQPLETLYLSAVSVAELRSGVALLPAGKRKAALAAKVETQLLPNFFGRVLAFDLSCTAAYGQAIAFAKAAGRAIDTADGLIAATALAHGFSIASRDETPFRTAGLKVINPWAA